jgi:two-component system heavy metal sensor histidine kinase CusS
MENTGEGIAPEYLERVFDRFFRVDPSRQRSSEGTGLGLAIAKSIVVAHGGTISVASVDGATTFWITLPRAGLVLL